MRIQARNLLPILGVHIRQHRILARRDMRRQIHILLQLHLALLQRTLEIHIPQHVAEIIFLVDECDEAVFDRDVDFGAFFNFLFEDSRGEDREGFATAI